MSAITVLTVHKPARTTAEATAKVQTSQDTTVEQIITAGLEALGETRDRLYGYGVRGVSPRPSDAELEPGVYVVYAHRD